MFPKKLDLGICENYLNGESSVAIAKRTGRSPRGIREVLERNGIPRRGKSECERVYSCDHQFFGSLSEESAYWTGFIAADGYVSRDGVLSLTLADKDRGHLQRFLLCCKSNHRILPQSQSGRIYASVRISSPQISSDLLDMGVGPAKTFTLQWPSLPPEMERHFLRGYVDGDGCFTGTTAPNGRFDPVFWLIGSPMFLPFAQSLLMSSCGLRPTKLRRTGKSMGVLKMAYSGRLQVLRIAHFLYDDALVFLPRKKSVMLP